LVRGFILSPEFRPVLASWREKHNGINAVYCDRKNRHYSTFWDSMCEGRDEACNTQVLHVVYYRLGVVSSLTTRGGLTMGKSLGSKWKADYQDSRTNFFHLCGETFLHVLLWRLDQGCIDQISSIGGNLASSKRPGDSTVNVLPVTRKGVVRGYSSIGSP
jgi:hypothetical protein